MEGDLNARFQHVVQNPTVRTQQQTQCSRSWVFHYELRGLVLRCLLHRASILSVSSTNFDIPKSLGYREYAGKSSYTRSSANDYRREMLVNTRRFGMRRRDLLPDVVRQLSCSLGRP